MKSLLKLGLLIAIILFLSASMAKAKVVGGITYVEPIADALHSGETRFTPLSSGDSVFLKDIVRTGANGKAVIEFDNRNVLRLAPFTRLDMEEYLREVERTGTIKLSRGKVRVVTPKKFRIIPVVLRKEPAFEIHTPTAVVGIRGSDAFIFHERGITGAIFVKGSGYAYSINFPEVVQKISAGEAVFITGYAPAPPPRPVSKFEMAVHMKDTSPTEEEEAPTEEGTPEWSGSPESSEYTETLETKPEIATPEVQERMVPTTEITAVETESLLPVTETHKEETVGTRTAAAVISGTLEDGKFWYYSGGSMNSQGSLSGSFSGTSGNWTDGWDSVSFSAGYTNPTSLWLTKMKGTATGSSGNFEGYVGGIKLDYSPLTQWALGIYIDPDQNAGYLIGDLSHWDFISGSFSATGDLDPVQMSSNIGIAPGDLENYLTWSPSYSNIVDYSGMSYFPGTFYGPPDISNIGNLYTYAASGTEWDLWDLEPPGSGLFWGAWFVKYGGTVSGTTSDDWHLDFMNSSGNASPWEPDVYVRLAIGLGNEKWSDNEITGTAYGYHYDDTDCSILYGETLGTYSASSTTTFQALTYGYGIDAEMYWEKLQSDTATLTALNIPVTEVYSTTLTGSGSFTAGGSLTGVTMNTKFLGATAASEYGLWSSSISGSYYGSTGSGWSISSLTSGSDYATITGREWSGGRFVGEVTDGSANGGAIHIIRGAVAGDYSGGSFSGYGGGFWEGH